MSENSNSMLVILLVVGLVVGAGVGYFLSSVNVIEFVEVEVEVPVVKYVEKLGNFPVQPIYSEDIPKDLTDVNVFNIGGYMIFVWYENNFVLWSYAEIGR